MSQLEVALATFEDKAIEAQKSIEIVAKSIRRLVAEARTGNVQQIEKVLAQLPAQRSSAAATVGGLVDAWAFDARKYLESNYLAELMKAAREEGLELFVRDGRLYAFPTIVRLLPAEPAVKIAGKTERGIRPKEVVAKLAALQKRPQRLNVQRFLELLYRAYQKLAGLDWRKVERGAGPAVLLADIHEVLTLLPGTDYPVEEFGRDLLLLDRQPALRNRDGASFRFGGSTLSRTSRRITVYDESGNIREFVALTFAKET